LAARAHVRTSLPRHLGYEAFDFAPLTLGFIAAEAPETAAKLSFVTSVGGHHDLRRVLRFLIHDEIETPSGHRA
jgi:hypothetical protein